MKFKLQNYIVSPVTKEKLSVKGGKLGETAENAILREIKEELGVETKIIRPLWLNQGFFEEDATKEEIHENCIYFLIDISETDVLNRGLKFEGKEETHTHKFEWLPSERVQEEYIYPLFIKEKIFNLPKNT